MGGTFDIVRHFVGAVLGGVPLLAGHPIGFAVAEKHCSPESVGDKGVTETKVSGTVS